MFLRFLFLCVFLFAGVTASLAAPSFTVVRDAEIENALKEFSKPIFESAGLSASTVTFVILQDSSLNAFVAGGENIFIHTGLILETKNAEELIGVIAHETGHIAGGHLFRMKQAVENLSLQAMVVTVLGAAVGIGAKSGEAGAAIGYAGQNIVQRNILRHSRTQESAADQAGVRFLKESGIPLSGFLSFMEKLSSQELLPDSQQDEYVRTHPLTRDRIEFLRNISAQKSNASNATVPAASVDKHARIKAKLLGYLYPDRALQNKADDVYSNYARAIAFYRKGKTNDALALLEKLIALEKDNPYFLELKGQILFESGRVKEALAPYARATTQLPSAGLIQSSYARALLEDNQLDKAIDVFKKAIRTEPHQSESFRMLGIAYGKKGEEGLSRLYLAEEAFLQGKLDFAKKEAGLAKENLSKKSAAYVRAQDILTAIAQAKKNEDKDQD